MYKLEDSIGYLTHRAGGAMSRRLRRNFEAENLPINMQQWQILVQLWQSDGCNQKDISDNLCKDKTSITRLIDNMEKSGLLMRKSCEADRRSKKIFLTDKGKSLKEPCFAVAAKTIQEASNGISEADLDIFKSVLHKIFQNLDAD